MIIGRLLARWTDQALTRRCAELQSALDAARLTTKVIEAERDTMAAVIARDRERIKAEGACYARQRAEAEGVEREQRTSQGI